MECAYNSNNKNVFKNKSAKTIELVILLCVQKYFNTHRGILFLQIKVEFLDLCIVCSL